VSYTFISKFATSITSQLSSLASTCNSFQPPSPPQKIQEIIEFTVTETGEMVYLWPIAKENMEDMLHMKK
jgi:hypothetical protein